METHLSFFGGWPISPPKKGGGTAVSCPPLFGPCIVVKRLDGSRCHLVHWPRPHCVRWGPNSPSKRGLYRPNRRPTSRSKTHVQKAHPWDVDYSPLNDYLGSQLCHLSCRARRNTAPGSIVVLFCDLENLLRRTSEIFHWCTHAKTDSRLSFHKWSKSVQDKSPKGGCIDNRKNNIRFGILRRNRWGDFPHF